MNIDNYKFEFTRIELKKNEFGKNDLMVKQIKLMDKNGKYIKFASINDSLLEALKNKGEVLIKK